MRKQMSKKEPQFTLHVISNLDGLESLKAIFPRDGTRGLVIGEDWEVKEVYHLLGEYLASGKHDGEISDYHEQLGTTWLTIGQAAELASELKADVSQRTIRWAVLHKFIGGAEKIGRDWRFPKRTFLHWLNHRPKPGRKSTTEVEHA